MYLIVNEEMCLQQLNLTTTKLHTHQFSNLFCKIKGIEKFDNGIQSYTHTHLHNQQNICKKQVSSNHDVIQIFNFTFKSTEFLCSIISLSPIVSNMNDNIRYSTQMVKLEHLKSIERSAFKKNFTISHFSFAKSAHTNNNYRSSTRFIYVYQINRN